MLTVVKYFLPFPMWYVIAVWHSWLWSWSHERRCSMLGQVSTWIGYRVRVQLSVQPGHPYVSKRNEYWLRMVMLCSWAVKAGMARVW